jgi:hypothetical protein
MPLFRHWTQFWATYTHLWYLPILLCTLSLVCSCLFSLSVLADGYEEEHKVTAVVFSSRYYSVRFFSVFLLC